MSGMLSTRCGSTSVLTIRQQFRAGPQFVIRSRIILAEFLEQLAFYGSHLAPVFGARSTLAGPCDFLRCEAGLEVSHLPSPPDNPDRDWIANRSDLYVGHFLW